MLYKKGDKIMVGLPTLIWNHERIPDYENKAYFDYWKVRIGKVLTIDSIENTFRMGEIFFLKERMAYGILVRDVLKYPQEPFKEEDLL